MGANNEEALLQAVVKQPVIVANGATRNDFKDYKGGIFREQCGTIVNHVITLVNFDTVDDGACWEFSVVATLEGALEIARGTLMSLSKPKLVDCIRGGRSDGCTSDFPEEAFDYVIRRGASLPWRVTLARMQLELVAPRSLFTECLLGICSRGGTRGSAPDCQRHTRVPLEPKLVDCIRGGWSDGCTCGFLEKAFDYVIRCGGVSSEAGYPYEKAVGTYRFKEASQRVYFLIYGYEWVSTNNEETLLQAVAKQPVIVAIDASRNDFKDYNGGIFRGQCGTILNHVITLVGFDTDDDGSKYWIGKNSWETNWG
ncbi:senescence-specific cysteine protease SAG39-like [Lotus japonicus]|uniref:senescence-specific cysteine protease SAG39-like n=1 Tax=Lotus japonicus TaxID=34305 RepID=UPI00258255C7|nr:senescence-specific cysteine protease SAG39-like [Lotus japonicus]